MANVLPFDNQVSVIGALAEGMSIRAIERMFGIHRDTIMRLCVRVGQGCQKVLDRVMRNLNSDIIQLDELWGFIGKKQKRVTPPAGSSWMALVNWSIAWAYCLLLTKALPRRVQASAPQRSR